LKRNQSAGLASGLALVLLVSCSSAPKVPDEVFDTRNQATDYVKLADSLVAKGQYESALKYYRQAIDLDSSVDSLDSSSLARSSLGRLWLVWGDLDAASAEFAKAEDYARLAGSPRALALALTGRGEVAFRKHDLEAAFTAFESAVAAAGTDEASLGIALHDRASAAYGLGRTAEAKADLEKALAINTKLKRWSELASNRYLLATFLAKEGDLEGALKAGLEALANDKKSENAAGISGDLVLLADLSGRAGKDVEAYWYWRRAFDAALGANLASEARRALEGLIAAAPKAGREAEVVDWKSALEKLGAISK
jgi:tetratricopeptide (TPR) repeat protein